MDIVGTTMTISNYLSKSEAQLSVQAGHPQKQEIVLPENRKYRIPLFQRELRWNEANVNVLLADLSKGERFLGNIILSIRSEGICEIIDGQQRTTIIRMILECVRKKYSDEIELFDLCTIENQSFPGFEQIASVGFEEKDLSASDLEMVLEGDVYNQMERVRKLKKALDESQILNDRYKAKALIENLKASKVNIIASYADAEDISIRYFLDVNLKGVQLDTEDIFKSYIFSQDSREETRILWQENKQLVFKLNTIKNGKNEKRYPLMKIYEHFLYCDLYLPKENGQDFSGIKFGENFCLTSQFDGGGLNTFYEGTHIIEAICNKTYIYNLLKRIKKSIEIMIDIVANEGPSEQFKKLFICPERIDSVDISNCHIILQRILLDKEIVPKVLASKYILSLFDGETHNKAEYKSIYSVFAAGVLFSIFAHKKESEAFYNIIKSTAWFNNLDARLYEYLSSYELTRGKLQAAYKYSEGDDDDNLQQVSCKSLAAIVNFMQIKKQKNKFALTVNNFQGFNDFLRNKDKFSVEHFIIGESGTLNIVTEKYNFNYSYPAPIKKYRNSLFNYIFIPRALNNSLGNELFHNKLDIITESISDIECEYSKKYYELLKNKCFPQYPTMDELDQYDTEDEAKEYLDNYFSEQFAGEFLEFATNLLEEAIVT